jgi:glutamate synthase (NADPH/NADH) small chain
MGTHLLKRDYSFRRKPAGKVAVIGGGISGISAALELDRKGFQVTIYEKSEQLGGRLWDYEGANLDQGVLF